MIKMTVLQAETIQDEWLHEALTKGLKECVTAPVLILDPTKPEPIKRAEMIIENFSREDCKCMPTLVVPGNLIQMLLPKDEVLLSIIFQYREKNTYIQAVIQKLHYYEPDNKANMQDISNTEA
ncbi:MAG: hypothetical protein [Bacteriophage sp.]|nr:MAG: hypothetical protein [Bacteriophage sp.]